jgi:hypothetical protein
MVWILIQNLPMEYTAEMTAFDMEQCKIVHGWLINPYSEEETYTVIGRKSYNELVDILISSATASTTSISSNDNDNDTTSSTSTVSSMDIQLSKLLSEIDTTQQQLEQQEQEQLCNSDPSLNQQQLQQQQQEQQQQQQQE